jgi:hypothetical protein
MEAPRRAVTNPRIDRGDRDERFLNTLHMLRHTALSGQIGVLFRQFWSLSVCSQRQSHDESSASSMLSAISKNKKLTAEGTRRSLLPQGMATQKKTLS